MAKHIVKQGDCIESIAFEKGFFWETIWNLPENAELKLERKDPNVLLAGDQVFIPDKREKTDVCATEQRHRFRRKGVPSMLRIVLEDEERKPRTGVQYTLEIDGQLFSGETDAEGRLQHPMPPDAKGGKLIIGTGDDQEEHELQLGNIDPITEISGVQARLNNLGFDCGEVDGVLNAKTRTAVERFQQEYSLPVSGEIDQETRENLKQVYGC